MLIYTVIFGPYDKLKEPEIKQRCPMICFTDQPFKSEHWLVEQIQPPLADPRRASRVIKILPFNYLKDDTTIYVDGSLKIRGDLRLLADSTPAAFSICKHRDRECVYEEFKACRKRKKDSDAVLAAQEARYRSEGLPPKLGLYENGLLLRNLQDPATKRLCLAWWAEYEKASCRDQPALIYAAWKLDIWPHMMPMNVWDNPYVKREKHVGK